MGLPWQHLFVIISWVVSIWLSVVGIIAPLFSIDAPLKTNVSFANATSSGRWSMYLFRTCESTGSMVFLMNADECQPTYTLCAAQMTLLSALRGCVLCTLACSVMMTVLACVRACTTWSRANSALALVPSAAALALFFVFFAGASCEKVAPAASFRDLGAALSPAVGVLIGAVLKALTAVLIFGRLAREESSSLRDRQLDMLDYAESNLQSAPFRNVPS